MLGAAGSILAAVALFGVAIALLLGHELRSSLDQALRRRAQEVAELAVSAPAVLTYPGGLESPVSGRQIAVEVIDAEGRILARSLALAPRLLPQDPLARAARLSGRTGFEDLRVGALPYRLYAAPIAEAGGPAAGGAVLVASDTADVASTVGQLELVLALSGAGVALLAALGAAALTRRGLAPLRRLAGAAGEIERTADPSRRLPEPGAADEIGQLTGVLNRMLASLERSRETERRFLADASHELRTPVTTLRGNVEYAARHGADAEVLADLQRDAARLARLVDDLLVLERAGSPAPELSPVELDRLVRDVADSCEGTGATVRLGELEHVRVSADEGALARALENLIENAAVHGPPGGEVTVTVTTSEGEDQALLTVSDSGTGPDPAHRDRLFERFWRAPGAAERPGSASSSGWCWWVVPVDFLTGGQVAAYGRYAEVPSVAQLERFFHFDERDRSLIARRRGDHNRLGFATQLGTVRFLGTFLARPADVPEIVARRVAEEVGVADPGSLRVYARREPTHREHAGEIQREYGYRDFADPSAQDELLAWLDARAWATAERPSVLFDLATARLIEAKVLLPGASVLGRAVASARDRAAARLHGPVLG